MAFCWKCSRKVLGFEHVQISEKPLAGFPATWGERYYIEDGATWEKKPYCSIHSPRAHAQRLASGHLRSLAPELLEALVNLVERCDTSELADGSSLDTSAEHALIQTALKSQT
jgi:hypothetical protein